MTTTNTIHPFEAAGLGLAPFRYVGMVQQNVSGGLRSLGTSGGVEFFTKPGGTCAYCGTYIVQMFNIRSADGKEFHVGCDCVRKTGDNNLIRIIEQDEKAARKATKLARENARIAAAVAKLPAVQGTLAAEPHPTEAAANRGRTLLDWVRWMLENAGQAGKLRVASVIERAAK
jgi:hypothetical protein